MVWETEQRKREKRAEWEGSEGWEVTWLLWLSWWLPASFVNLGTDKSEDRESGVS